ncbi:MAG: universal stress protein [Rubrivivax sp.]|nr:universal stress protein [Rubrivivax sp.]MCL4697906.1 universal stress protein [Burkholderiaceae bacterium]
MTVKRILVPVDNSELSQRAIDASLELAQQMHAGIVGFVAGTRGARDALIDETEGDEETGDDALTGRPVLARFRRAARAAGVPFESVFERVPRVDKAIIAAAEAHRCDLIVMVTHGRGVFGEFLFGSQTKAVLAGSKLPLLVLH